MISKNKFNLKQPVILQGASGVYYPIQITVDLEQNGEGHDYIYTLVDSLKKPTTVAEGICECLITPVVTIVPKPFNTLEFWRGVNNAYDGMQEIADNRNMTAEQIRAVLFHNSTVAKVRLKESESFNA